MWLNLIYLLNKLFVYVDKQKENDCLRETLSKRTAKLELSRKECETLLEERTHLQNSLYRYHTLFLYSGHLHTCILYS